MKCTRCRGTSRWYQRSAPTPCLHAGQVGYADQQPASRPEPAGDSLHRDRRDRRDARARARERRRSSRARLDLRRLRSWLGSPAHRSRRPPGRPAAMARRPARRSLRAWAASDEAPAPGADVEQASGRGHRSRQQRQALAVERSQQRQRKAVEPRLTGRVGAAVVQVDLTVAHRHGRPADIAAAQQELGRPVAGFGGGDGAPVAQDPSARRAGGCGLHAADRTLAEVFGSTPNANVRRGVEMAIRVAAPALDLMLLVGDGVSRVLHPGDRGYSLARVPHDGDSAPRGLHLEPADKQRSSSMSAR